MKLSEITGERNATVLAELLIPIGEIVSDDKYANMFPIPAVKGETQSRTFTKFAFKVLPGMLKTHSKAVCEILAIVSEKPAESMTFADIVKGVNDLIHDEAFMSFFSTAEAKEQSSPQPEASEK